MKIQFEIKNRQVFFAVIFISFVTLLTLAIAYGTASPSVFGHSAGEIGEGTIANTLTISGGNVGIGTTSPAYKLSVQASEGKAYATASTYTTTLLLATNTDEIPYYGGYGSCGKFASQIKFYNTAYPECAFIVSGSVSCQSGVNFKSIDLSKCYQLRLGASSFGNIICETMNPTTGNNYVDDCNVKTKINPVKMLF